MSKRPPAPYDARRTPLVVGRVPLLPVSAIADVYAADDPLDALRTLLAGSSFVRQALRVASPSLAEAIDAWLAGQPLRNPDAPLRALSYVARMAARTTPFGIFAGIGAVELGDETTLRLDESARRTHTRPDMGLLWELVSAIESGASRRRVAYVTNEAAFERGGRLYVTNVELTSYEQTEESFATAQRPVSLKNTDAVRFVRELARTPRPYEQIAAALGERFEAAAPECEKVLDRLIESGVLISELRASPVGDPVGYIRERVRAIDPDAAAPLEKALAGAAALDAKPLAARSDAQYRNVVERFAALSAKPADHAVQIDTYVPFSGTLGAAIFEDVERLAELCMRQGATLSLAKLRSRFEQRYEGSERLVPLLELVDPNVGLGLPDGLERDEAASAERDALLTAMACEALRCGSEEIELSAEVLETLAPSLGDGVELPDSLEIGFHLAATSREALDRGEYRVIPAAFGASERATRSLGRFAHLFDVPLQRRIEEVARRSVNPERLNAELCFVPSASRIYNVMVRPELLGETIAIGVGGPRTGREMTPDDLWVGLDGGRFYLWSQSRRRRVHPCETHVFNTDRSAPNICRFLASVAGDGRRFPGWFGWGPASTLAYLPRVRSGNLVLATRQWRLRMKELGATAQTAARTLERWRELWNLPRYVYLTESDNRLLLDLDSPIAPALLLDQRNEREETAIVTEALPVPGAEWLEGEQGGYAVEFVAALLPRHVAAHEEPAAEPVTLRERRKFGLGSSWSYIKLYLGEQAFDDFLLRTVLPAVGEFSSTGRIDRWFYVRYADPQPHLRLRLRATGEHAGEVRGRLVELTEEWLREARVERTVFDTYDPEYERYGGESGLEAAERFFTADSEVCAELSARTPDLADARVAAAVESFLPWIGEGEPSELAASVLGGAARRKLAAADREALKRLGAIPCAQSTLLEEALAGASRESRFATLFHMHCNRLGLRRDAEERAVTLLRAALLSRAARRPERVLSRRA